MQLNKQHRETLLTELTDTQNAIDLNNSLLNSKRPEVIDLMAAWEIKDFTLTAKLDLIKKALINNEIDY